MLKKLKNWLATVNKTSWHYRFVTWVQDEKSLPAKACTYYWICIPRAFVILACFSVVFGVVSLFAFFFGFTQNFTGDESKTNKDAFFPYKTRRDGTRKRFAPWEISAVIFGGWLVFKTLFWVPEHTSEIAAGFRLLAIVLATVMIFLLVIFLLFRFAPVLFKGAKQKLQKGWDEICPQLVVVGKETTTSNEK